MFNELHPARLPVFTSTLLALLATAAMGCGGSTSNPDGPGGNTGDSGTEPMEAGVDTGHPPVEDSAIPQQDSAAQPETGAPAGVLAVPLSACSADVYSVGVTVGAQTFQVIVDTGSSTLGVASSTCTNCNVTPEYTPGSTAVNENMPTSIQYASGSWSGQVYQDQVGVGTSQAAPVKMAAITSQTNFFEPMQCDSASGTIQGLIGFGPPLAIAQGTELWFNNYVTAANVPNIFATELCETGGTLWLGGYDPSHTTAPPQYTPKAAALASYYHAVTLTSITVGTTTTPVASGSAPYTVMDTGTSVFLMGSTPYTAIAAAIQADATFTSIFSTGFFPAVSGSPQPNCKAGITQTKAQLDAMLPELTYTFDGTPPITVKGVATESYLLQAQGEWCTAMVGYDFSGEPIAAIMGAAALKSNVVIFDQGQSRIGFAPHTPCP